MASKERDLRRIVCYGDKIAVIEKENIVRLIIVDENLLKNNIDELIESETTILEPYWIFRTAVENITGYVYFGNRTTPKVEGALISIHDQPIYKQWRDYILNTPKLRKRSEQYLKGLKARKEFFKKNKEILEYEEKTIRKIVSRNK